MTSKFGRGRALRIGLISVSSIADDPRVRRQGDLFFERGWEVIAVGLPGGLSPAPSWRCMSAGGPEPAQVMPDAEIWTPGVGNRHDRGGRQYTQHDLNHRSDKQSELVSFFAALRRRIQRATDVAGVYLQRERAFSAYWRINKSFGDIYGIARKHYVDIWLANDWTAIPIVRKLAAEQGTPYAYDTHELAIDEYAHSWKWRIIHKPVVAAIERLGIAGASVTSCVSQGIADSLQHFYDLPAKPLLVRNVPRYEAHIFRPCGETLEVLYHGVVNTGRGLEACIDSVALWRPEFRLTIRGPGPTPYLTALAARIKAAGLCERVVLAPPVPMIELVREANAFDIGLFALPGHSEQNLHVLPNKFFEYTMAGLALCVSDLPEMTSLLRKHELGRLIPDVTPGAIAAAINGFDRVEIDLCKRRALEAAKLLNWEAESDRFFKAIKLAVESRPLQRFAS